MVTLLLYQMFFVCSRPNLTVTHNVRFGGARAPGFCAIFGGVVQKGNHIPPPLGAFRALLVKKGTSGAA